jgi:RHS repeat-associated protein
MQKIPPKLLSLALFVLPCIAHAQVSVTLIIHNRTDTVGCDMDCMNPIYRCGLTADTACFGGSMTVDSNATPGDYIYGLYTSDGYRVGRQADYRVNADGTSGWVANDPGFGCVNGWGGPVTLSVHCDFAPTGSVHSEASALANVNVITVCDNRNVGDLTNINLPLFIGTTARPEYSKANDKKLCPEPGQPSESPQMALYSAHLMLASLNIEDTPIRYSPPRGPQLNLTVSYSQRESQQPQTFSYSNLGPKWTFNWLSYVTDNPNNIGAEASAYVSGGGIEVYSGFNSGTQSYLPDPQSHAVIVRTSSNTYEKRFPDGSRHVFGPQSNGSSSYPRLLFMTQMVDAAGNAATINYDGSNRVTSVTDATGQRSVTFSYELSGDSLKITKVTDPFGRYAGFGYTNGQLTSITDPIGIQSQFGYASGTDFINSVQTPYGTSTFTTDSNSNTNHWIEMTDPLGGKERVEYRNNAPGINASDPSGTVPAGFTNSDLDVANTFYWDKKAIQIYPPVNGVYDYTKARIIHWAKNADGSVSGIAASEKAPLENRVWYSYTGQTNTNHVGPSGSPSQVARVLDDGTTQASQYEYNSIGKITKATDPIGRVTSYVYDTNNVDLLTVYQKNLAGVSTDPSGAPADKVARYTYNSLHEPLTATDAASKTTTYTYRPDGHGQLQSVQNAKGETTTYGYGPVTGIPTDYLASVSSPTFNNLSAVTSLTYDSANRVRTVTSSPDNYTVTTDYDALDRPTQVTYPDGTNQQFQYFQDFGQGLKTILDLTKSKDRRDRWTTRHYNANRQVDSITDPLTRQTLYGWCSCGSLTSITDPRGKVTVFNRDLQSRVASKQFADNTSVSYIYENTTSRLKSMTDALNQTTNYQYFLDDNRHQISYAGALHATSGVSFAYDPNYNRIASMTDGTGITNYGYFPVANPPALGANQLQSVDGPLLNDTISYSYDELGRVTNRSINGASNALTWAFDSLGRTSSEMNNLGAFTYAYDSVTNRLIKVTYPNGESSAYTYLPNIQDRRLQEIKSLTSRKKLISQFDYTYDVEGQILSWTQDNPSLSRPQRYDFGYDYADQLLTAPLRDTSRKNTLIKQFTYAYDFGGNRTSEQVGMVTTTAVPNDVNEIVSQSGGTNRTLTYDLNGNLIDDGRTFEWDAANRLLAINYTGTSNRSEFTYDGLGRRVKVVEKNGSTVTSTKQFVWNGSSIAEERDASNVVTRRFYSQGEQVGAASYFCTRDHLGSIRELTDGSGVVQARYDYDPYGRRTKIGGTLDADFGFTGHYYHAASNLHLALYRAYDADLGRWLSRDPIGEKGGVNLYAYVLNQPMLSVDRLGLDAIVLFDPHAVRILGSSQGHIAILVGNNSSGWTYYSRNGYGGADGNGDNVLQQFPNFEAFRNSVFADRYDQAYHIRTTSDEDLAMITYGDANLRDPYHTKWPPSNNCADLTEEILEAGGHPIPGESTAFGSIEVPRLLFPNLIGSNMGHLWNVPLSVSPNSGPNTAAYR